MIGGGGAHGGANRSYQQKSCEVFLSRAPQRQVYAAISVPIDERDCGRVYTAVTAKIKFREVDRLPLSALLDIGQRLLASET